MHFCKSEATSHASIQSSSMQLLWSISRWLDYTGLCSWLSTSRLLARCTHENPGRSKIATPELQLKSQIPTPKIHLFAHASKRRCIKKWKKKKKKKKKKTRILSHACAQFRNKTPLGSAKRQKPASLPLIVSFTLRVGWCTGNGTAVTCHSQHVCHTGTATSTQQQDRYYSTFYPSIPSHPIHL